MEQETALKMLNCLARIADTLERLESLMDGAFPESNTHEKTFPHDNPLRHVRHAAATSELEE
jgi:hypothetical protein